MENTLNSKRYFGIDGLRMIAMLLIVLFHVLIRFPIDAGKIKIFLSSFVSLFMVISAFSLSCGYYEKIKNNQISINEFYKKRYIRIWPLFSIIVILDVVFSGLTKNNLFEGFANITLLFGFLPHSDISIVGVGWTIGVIFAFYLLFPFFVFATWNKKRAYVFFVLSLLFRYVSYNYFLETNIVNIHSFFVWIPYFVLGIIIYLHREDLIVYLSKFKYLILFITLFLLVIKYLNPIFINKDLYDFYRILSDTSLVIFVIICPNKVLCNKYTKCISGISYGVYITHMMFLKILLILRVDKILKSPYFGCIVLYFVLIIVVIIFNLCLEYIKNIMLAKYHENCSKTE